VEGDEGSFEEEDEVEGSAKARRIEVPAERIVDAMEPEEADLVMLAFERQDEEREAVSAGDNDQRLRKERKAKENAHLVARRIPPVHSAPAVLRPPSK
jgi:hypothetical protein